MKWSTGNLIAILFSVALLCEGMPQGSGRHHQRKHLGRRHHRQIPHYPARNEQLSIYCSSREHHVTCGPEKHCDRSCENMYSPPHCFHDTSNPKCYFPRCLCNDGYVRNAVGHCIRETHCPNRYSEDYGKTNQVDNDGMVMEFVPFVQPRKRVRKVRHHHHFTAQ